MKNKIFIIIYIILAAIILFFAFQVIKKRYLEQPAEEKPAPPAIEENVPREIPEKDFAPEPITEESQKEEKKFREITEEDCANNCLRFENEIELQYCRQVCGLVSLKADTENCDDLEGLKKDYCLKDLAVSKKDFNICKKIADGNIRKTCKNRVTEEILNGK